MLKIEHREIRARRRAGGVVWFDFRELCGGPRSQNDYLELATQFHTLLLSGVPQMSPRLASEARRFTWLVDVLYDRRVKLIMSAEVEPEALYTEGPLVHEFPRTVSRLREMRSAEFLARGAPQRRHVADMNVFRILASRSGAARRAPRRPGSGRAGPRRRRATTPSAPGSPRSARPSSRATRRGNASAGIASSSRRASTMPRSSAGAAWTRCGRASSSSTRRGGAARTAGAPRRARRARLPTTRDASRSGRRRAASAPAPRAARPLEPRREKPAASAPAASAAGHDRPITTGPRPAAKSGAERAQCGANAKRVIARASRRVSGRRPSIARMRSTRHSSGPRRVAGGRALAGSGRRVPAR